MGLGHLNQLVSHQLRGFFIDHLLEELGHLQNYSSFGLMLGHPADPFLLSGLTLWGLVHDLAAGLNDLG